MPGLGLACHYFQATRQNVTAFFRWTVQARLMGFVVFTSLVLLRLVPAPLFLARVADLAGTLWTAWALRAAGRKGR